MSGASKSRSGAFVRFMVSTVSALLPLTLIFPHLALAQQDERSVRAAFVYNLTKYVTWPNSLHELNICVIGSGATVPALQLVVDGKQSGGRTIHIVKKPSDAELRRCEIVYWSDSTMPGIRSILDRARGTPVLTVGEDDRFMREGGMIGFIRSGDSIQIEVNLESVKAEGLSISSRLLDLAQIVHADKARKQ